MAAKKTRATRFLSADWVVPDNVIAGTCLVDGEIEALQLPGTPTWLTQVHEATVVDAGPYEAQPKADACVGRQVGDVCAIRTADCLPVLFAARDGSVVAAAHAGWRGLCAGVLENTVASMRVNPKSISVWFGPAISAAAFEVGDEVRAAFVDTFADDASAFAKNYRGRWQADLYALATARLSRVGVHQISGGGLCTYSDTTRFFSYRRNPDCGRMISVIALCPG